MLIIPSVVGNELKMLATTSDPNAMKPKTANVNDTSHDEKTAIPAACPHALRVGCFIDSKFRNDV